MQTCESPLPPTTCMSQELFEILKILSGSRALLARHAVQCTVLGAAHTRHGACGDTALKIDVYPYMLQLAMPAVACSACRKGSMEALVFVDQIIRHKASKFAAWCRIIGHHIYILM